MIVEAEEIRFLGPVKVRATRPQHIRTTNRALSTEMARPIYKRIVWFSDRNIKTSQQLCRFL